MLTAPTTGDNDEAYGAAKADAAEAASWMIGSSMTASTTFSLVPEVRTFGSGSTEAGSGSTEAVMTEKGNDGKFDAVTFYVEQRISIDEDDPLIKL